MAQQPPESQPSQETITADGIAWRTLRWGPRDGEGILLLHGFPQDAASWQPLAAALAHAGYQAVAFDQRGASTATLGKGGNDYTFDTFKRDALNIADATGMRQFHVMGFGWGGALAWMLAANYPERVISITALRYPHPAAFVNGIEHDPEQKAAWEDVRKQIGPQNMELRATDLLANNAKHLREFLRKSGLPAAYVDRYVARLSEPGVLLAGLSWGKALVPEYFAAVPAVHVPALYLWSEGPAVSRATAAACAQFAASDYRYVELSGVGHFMLETSPQMVVAPVLEFLRRVDSTAPSQTR